MIIDFVGIDPGKVTGIAVFRSDIDHNLLVRPISIESRAIELDEDYDQDGLKGCVGRIVKEVHHMTRTKPKPIVGVETAVIGVMPSAHTLLHAYLVGGLLCSDLNPIPVNPRHAKFTLNVKPNMKSKEAKQAVLTAAKEMYGFDPQGNQLARQAQADAFAVALATRLLTDR